MDKKIVFLTCKKGMRLNPEASIYGVTKYLRYERSKRVSHLRVGEDGVESTVFLRYYYYFCIEE